MLHSLRHYEESEVAGQRMRIIRFYETYGERAAKEAFGADRKLIHVWKKRLREAEGRLAALVPHSTRPQRTRQMQVEPRVVEFIRAMRQRHPRMGKEKLKLFVDRYCGSTGLPAVSVSTIGKVIKRHKFFFQRSGRVYHDPKNAKRYAKKTKRLRVKHSPRHRECGHFQADSSVRFIDGLRRYLISAIDSRLKFSFSNCYSTLTSRNSRDFLRRLEVVYPLKIRSVQTDNGAEFLGEFDAYLTKKGIPHYFSYPRCPKINGCVERFNRTLKEEFVDNNLDVIDDIGAFRERLAEYLVFYNTQRPHKTLGLKSPIDFLISEGAMSKMCGTHTLLASFPKEKKSLKPRRE
jgi:transposase InsO family protein